MIKKDVMNVAFLSLGGNINNRLHYIKEAIKAISNQCGTISKKSSIYETAAWGTDSKKKYLNQVIKLETTLDAESLLKKLLEIEKDLGRKRTKNQFSDRTIDLDILFYNKLIVAKKNIQLPHPRIHLRKFILIPLSEIEKRLMHPVYKKSIASLLQNCEDALEVKLHNPLNNLRYISIEGNIGSGKSTTALALAKKLKAALLLEKFEDNSLLPLFYAKPKLYAFPLEYSFLISRFEQIKNQFNKYNHLVVSDFSIYKCLWFAKVNLPKKEFDLFKKHFDAFVNQLPQPDLIIYLSSTNDNLLLNIKNRGRKHEKKVKANYLKLIGNKYNEGLKSLNGITRLNFTIDKYSQNLENELLKKIENFIKESFD